METSKTSYKTPVLILSTSTPVPTLKWNHYFLHSRYNPIKEAQNQLAGLKIPKKKGLVCVGGGLGYILKCFCEQHEGIAFWYEAIPEIADLAIKYAKLGPWIDSGRIVCLHQNLQEYQNRIVPQLFQNLDSSALVFYRHRASWQTSPSYQNVYSNIISFFNRKLANQATYKRFTDLWFQNLLSNLPLLAQAKPISYLKKRFPQRLAILCGAGPSLLDDIHIIESLQQHAIIASVDTAVNTLVQCGIQPDIVLSVDPQYLSHYYIRDYVLRSQYQTIFVVDPVCAPSMLRMVAPEQLYYFNTFYNLAHRYFPQLSTDAGTLAFGGSVSTTAYDFLTFLGCNPILLSGLDFAYTYGLAHVKGSPLELLHLYRYNRIQTLELQNYRQVHALALRKIKLVDEPLAQKVYSNDKLILFHKWFTDRLSIDIQVKKNNVLRLNDKMAYIPHLKKITMMQLHALQGDKVAERSFYEEVEDISSKSALASKSELFIGALRSLYLDIIEKGFAFWDALYADSKQGRGALQQYSSEISSKIHKQKLQKVKRILKVMTS